MAKSILAKLHRRFGRPVSRAELVEEAYAKAAALTEEPIAAAEEITPRKEGEFKPGATVAVVGAGFAGLSAAYYLSKERAQVTVFEPREEVGGRVRTLPGFVKDRLVEAGGELIGLNHSLWLALAREFELSLSVVTPEADFAGAGLEMPMW